MMVAAGILLVFTMLVGSTVSVDGADPNGHEIIAPLHT